MRENIGLFKAKRKDNGEWVEGLPIRSHIGFSSIIDTIQYAFGGYLPTHKIDPETLCECTGLKDKNGKLIFENDILYACGSYNLTVVWDNVNARFYAEYKGIKSGHEDDDNDDFADAYDFDSYEIIGNVFEEVRDE